MKKRSKYRPRDPVIPVVLRFGAREERNLQLIPHQYLAEFREGRGSEKGWHTLAARLNHGFVLARDNFDGDAVAVMSKALDALRAVYDRHQRLKTWGATGEEFFAMGDGLNLTDKMQLKCTRRELDAALKKIIPAGAMT